MSGPEQNLTIRMYEALRTCRNRFDEYEKSHAAKRTTDGYAKAARNAEMVALCDEVIEAYRETLPKAADAAATRQTRAEFERDNRDDPLCGYGGHYGY